MSAPLALPLMAFINSSVISITASELIRPEPAMVPKKNGSYIAMWKNNSYHRVTVLNDLAVHICFEKWQ